MANCSFLSIETPVKVYIRNKNEVSPVKVSKNLERWCPTPKMKKMLAQLLRAHDFQFHTSISFKPLEDLNISRKTAKQLTDFFQSEIDVPDVVKRLEEIAYKSNYYDMFMRDYITEEFECQTEYSFCVITVLHYIQYFKISIEEACEEVFFFSSSKSLCELCVPEENKNKNLAQKHNYELLTAMINSRVMVSDDLDITDDSSEDRTYQVKESGESTMSSSRRSCDQQSEDVKTSGSDEEFFFNPFIVGSKSAVNEQLNLMDVNKEYMNSTAIEESHPALQNGIEDISDIQVHVKCRGSSCKYCGKEFNNSNNMKQHLISIHKIFPPGMAVFKCPFKKCDFVSGNRVAFARHSHNLKG